MFQTNELLCDFGDLKILRQEDVIGEAEGAPGQRAHVRGIGGQSDGSIGSRLVTFDVIVGEPIQLRLVCDFYFANVVLDIAAEPEADLCDLVEESLYGFAGGSITAAGRARERGSSRLRTVVEYVVACLQQCVLPRMAYHHLGNV
jgi:hypothetical protein